MDEDAALAQPRANGRRALLTILRLAIGIALITILLVRTDLRTSADLFRSAELGHAIAALILMFGVLLVSSLRWLVVLRKLGFDEPSGFLIRLYLAGTFFNVFLPTGIGGDAYKVVRLGKQQRRLSSAVASVFLDRLAAIFALAAITTIGAASQLVSGDIQAPLALAGLASLGILVATAALFAFRKWLSALHRSGTGLKARLGRIMGSVGSVGIHAETLGRAGLLALAAQALLVASHVEIARALHIDVPWTAVAGGLVLTTLAAMVPVTVNGLGVREAVWVWTLTAHDVTSAAAVPFALGALVVLIAVSMVGGIVYVTGRHPVKERSSANSLGAQP